jgi:serine/threonine-protein kinase RsbT
LSYWINYKKAVKRLKKITLNKIAFENENELLNVRQIVKTAARNIGFGLVDQTRLITAVSELSRNAFEYTGKGVMLLEQVEDKMKTGLRIVFTDNGPGISDIKQAMTDGYSSGCGMGKGLSGSKRLMDEFSINSTVEEGTEVSIIKWLN